MNELRAIAGRLAADTYIEKRTTMQGELRRFIVKVAGEAGHNREIDGTWADAVRAIRAEFGTLRIREVYLVLPERRLCDVTDRFKDGARRRHGLRDCVTCGRATLRHNNSCVICGAVDGAAVCGAVGGCDVCPERVCCASANTNEG